MASVDLQFIRARKREIRRAIHQSSPMLICSGSLGIAIIAANKSAVRHRIGKVLDRMAVVSRGELTASDIVHKVAAAEAYALAHQLSRGDVLGHEPAQAVSTLLSQHYHGFTAIPMAVESCFVKLSETPDNDYLAHIGPDGSVQLFNRILYLGSVGRHLAHETQEAKESDPDHAAQEVLDEFNSELQRRWRDYPSASALIAELEQMPELSPLFTAGKRRDIVILDRTALAKRDFDKIFKRLTL